MNKRVGVPSIYIQAVRGLDEDYYLREEVGRLLDVAPSTLKHWGEVDPELAPTAFAMIGRRKVYLYTPEDVAALRAHQYRKYPLRADGLRTRRRGRPKLWSSAEMAERDRRQRRIAYLLSRARLAAMAGEEHRELALLAEVDQMKAHLAEEYAARFTEVTAPRRHQDDWLLATQM